jgi:uncharacterized C2H2 Zn-finger protein
VTGLVWWRCTRCDEVLRSWAAAERHVDEVHGAARLEWYQEPKP